MEARAVRIEELERCVLRAVVNNPQLFWSLSGMLRSRDFSVPRHRMAWEALRAGAAVPELDLDGPPVSAEEAREAARQVQVLSRLRDVRALSQEALRFLSDGAAADPERFLAEFVRRACLCAIPRPESVTLSAEEWMSRGLERIEARATGASRRLDLGFAGLSEGLSPEPGHLIIVAGETGKGKTALALNLAVKLGVVQGVPVLYVNTEMSWEELAIRLYAILSGVSVSRLRKGEVTAQEMGELRRLRFELAPQAKLWITDSLPWADVSEVAALARQGAAVAGIKVLIVDWVQRLEQRDPRREPWQLMIDAAKMLKSLAQELSVLTIAVAQLTEDHRLALSRGMSREADGEVHLYQLDGQGEASHVLEVIKARHAPTGTRIPLIMNRATLEFFELGPEQVEEVGQSGRKEPGNRRRNRT